MSSVPLRSALLGGLDGTITSVAVVAGASLAQRSRHAVSIIGPSSLVADGVSMGISEYLSTRAAGSERPARLGAVCFGSFVLCGSGPIVAYLAGADGSLLASLSVAALELLLLGVFRARVASEPLLPCLVQTAGLGSVAAAAAFGVAAVARAA